MITIDLANAIFIGCVAVGGILLLITVLLDDLLGGLLDFLHLGFDVGGVTLMPLLLGFVSAGLLERAPQKRPGAGG